MDDPVVIITGITAVLGLVTFYLRYYTSAALSETEGKLKDFMRSELRPLHSDIRSVETRVSRIEGQLGNREA